MASAETPTTVTTHPPGWEPHGHRSIAVDFDGVIHSYTTKWSGAHIIPDPPVPGAIEWLNEIGAHFRVVIFSTRAAIPEGIHAIKHWLVAWGFVREIEVTAIKPAALIYLDDRAVRFDGTNFPSAGSIHQMHPWHKRPMGDSMRKQ